MDNNGMKENGMECNGREWKRMEERDNMIRDKNGTQMYKMRMKEKRRQRIKEKRMERIKEKRMEEMFVIFKDDCAGITIRVSRS